MPEHAQPETANCCVMCGGTVTTRVLPHYTDMCIGVAVDVVDTVEEMTCTECGEQEVSFPDINELLTDIALTRVRTPTPLKGEEIFFLRKVLDLTRAEFATRLDIRSAQTIARWEKGTKQMGSPVEKRLRALVTDLLGGKA